ncbi:hypothetical protein A3B60_00450 [Candidatus Peregrinibacteria bacterium RIFCSPLOWO2_01_FULL_39_12]|nr:MAG: hypothetical protein A3B60_00450 [Candidatus Peregrinibacteria bacterium RIFCSPLOWO2_01_FULL_39_12]OGJ42211.1 MAG: hypothetical protein A3I58_01195 [Candidatus Peregrinibacteria bacterium RIFCSPLOWO2_02_FULL_39_10]
MKTRKLLGFTLIELLIVIAIIGILAVAFLPTIMGAPAKGRDAARIADLQKIQKVLINANLEGTDYPASTCITDASFTNYKTALGGKVPVEALASDWKLKAGTLAECNKTYVYVKAPTQAPATSSYSFGLYARMESIKAGNTKCTGLATASDKIANDAVDGDSCYAILTQ